VTDDGELGSVLEAKGALTAEAGPRGELKIRYCGISHNGEASSFSIEDVEAGRKHKTQEIASITGSVENPTTGQYETPGGYAEINPGVHLGGVGVGLEEYLNGLSQLPEGDRGPYSGHWWVGPPQRINSVED